MSNYDLIVESRLFKPLGEPDWIGRFSRCRFATKLLLQSRCKNASETPQLLRLNLLAVREGIKEDIACLPVHDAIAVQQQYQNWAKEVMLETWQEHMDGVGTKVKVDLP